MDYALLLVVLLFFVGIFLFIPNGSEKVEISDSVISDSGEEILVPDGYEFIDAFAFGRLENCVYVIRENATGKIYKFDGQRVGNEISIPAGYEFICASAYGDFAVVSYYVRNVTDGKVYKIEM